MSQAEGGPDPAPAALPPRRSLDAQTLHCVQAPSPSLEDLASKLRNQESTSHSYLQGGALPWAASLSCEASFRSSTKDSPRDLVHPLTSSHGVAVTVHSAFF